MVTLLITLVFCLGCEYQTLSSLNPGPSAESRAGDVAPSQDYEADLTRILADVVTADGLVRYGRLNDTHDAAFRSVLKAVEDFDARTLVTQEEKLAFWMNAYNVQMLQNIRETPTVQDIIADNYGDPFFKTAYRTAGRDMTLDELEHVILRRQASEADFVAWQVGQLDPRIHVGLNCAAVSCPRLRQQAFTAANVDAELNAAMRDFANGPAHFRQEGDAFVLSSLIDWFGADFDSQGEPTGTYLVSFMTSTRPDYAALKQLLVGRSAAELKALGNVRYEYLWTVNRAP